MATSKNRPTSVRPTGAQDVFQTSDQDHLQHLRDGDRVEWCEQCRAIGGSTELSIDEYLSGLGRAVSRAAGGPEGVGTEAFPVTALHVNHENRQIHLHYVNVNENSPSIVVANF